MQIDWLKELYNSSDYRLHIAVEACKLLTFSAHAVSPRLLVPLRDNVPRMCYTFRYSHDFESKLRQGFQVVASVTANRSSRRAQALYHSNGIHLWQATHCPLGDRQQIKLRNQSLRSMLL